MSEPNSKATPIPQSEVTRVKALGFLWDKRTPDSTAVSSPATERSPQRSAVSSQRQPSASAAAR